jgi:hypothetical protein
MLIFSADMELILRRKRKIRTLILYGGDDAQSCLRPIAPQVAYHRAHPVILDREKKAVAEGIQPSDTLGGETKGIAFTALKKPCARPSRDEEKLRVLLSYDLKRRSSSASPSPPVSSCMRGTVAAGEDFHPSMKEARQEER